MQSLTVTLSTVQPAERGKLAAALDPARNPKIDTAFLAAGANALALVKAAGKINGARLLYHRAEIQNRLTALALSINLARASGNKHALRQLAQEARQLAADLRSADLPSPADAQEVSDALLRAEQILGGSPVAIVAPDTPPAPVHVDATLGENVFIQQDITAADALAQQAEGAARAIEQHSALDHSPSAAHLLAL